MPHFPALLAVHYSNGQVLAGSVPLQDDPIEKKIPTLIHRGCSYRGEFAWM